VEVACLIPATGATGPAGQADGETSAAGSLVPLWVTLGVLLIGGLVAAEVVRRRRSGPARDPDSPQADGPQT
jgi:hypothetical protein